MDKESYLSIYRTMLASRYADNREEILSRQGKSFLQVPSRGHEGLAALSALLEERDILVPYWRNKALVLGKTHNVSAIAKEFFATASSSSGGRNMPSHFSDKENGVFSVVTSTGMQCLPACGIAWSFLKKNQHSIVVCTIGDGATRQGEFYEAWCFAKEKSLPIIFVVEDNKYAISTPTGDMSPLSLDIFHEDNLLVSDGADVDQLIADSKTAIDKARSGSPVILWCKLDRLSSHTNSDDCKLYRSDGELQSMSDPIENIELFLIENLYLKADDISRLHSEVKLEVDQVYDEVAQESAAPASSVKTHLYDDWFSYEDLIPPREDAQPATIVEAVNRALHEGFDFHSHAAGFGQDVEDPKGGVFGFTKGISSQYPERILNSPLSESTIVGTAVGLAATGIKPVFEIQFIDFLGVAFEQLVTQVSTLRWRSVGQWAAPLVLYAPYGAYLPGGGMWHSQSNEGFWCHIPGLRVAVPSNPQDTFELFWMAFQLPDPILILLPKHIMRKKITVANTDSLIFGCGKKITQGSDITIVAWGNCLSLVSELLPDFSQQNISVELIDPIFLNPLDFKLIKQSVIKTGRLLVVQEDNRTCSVGESIISEITNDEDSFYALLASPTLIARDNVHIPYQEDLEAAVLPSKEDVLTSTIAMVNGL
jgi:2-oxoisovalerate dehydrogenase E1 component